MIIPASRAPKRAPPLGAIRIFVIALKALLFSNKTKITQKKLIKRDKTEKGKYDESQYAVRQVLTCCFGNRHTDQA